MLSCVRLVTTPWTVALQVPQSMGFFSGKDTGVGCYFLPQGIFLMQGSNRLNRTDFISLFANKFCLGK